MSALTHFVGAPIGVETPRLLLLVVTSQPCLVGGYILFLALVGLLVGVKSSQRPWTPPTFDKTRQLCAE